jgi:hypothetical protein
MNEPAQPILGEWSILEIFGHQTYAGYLTTEYFGGACMFRLDVPELKEHERVIDGPEYVQGRYVPAGSTVKVEATKAFTKRFGVNSIYSQTPCTEEAALAALENIQRRPAFLVSLPDKPLLLNVPAQCPVCGGIVNECGCDRDELGAFPV